MINYNSFAVRYGSDCSNLCKFCFERSPNFIKYFGKFSTPSKHSMLLHNKILVDEIVNAYNKQETKITVKFMGGELFHRADMDELYEGFDDTVETLKSLNDKYDCFNSSRDLHNIIVASNLLYEDLSLLEYFTKILEVNNFQIIGMISFDIGGRFVSDVATNLFYTNFNYFYEKYLSRNNYIDFNLVLTGESMRIITNNQSCRTLDIFKEVYNRNIDIGFSYLMTTEKQLIGPLNYTEQEFLDFVECICAQYPKLMKSFFSAYKALPDKYSQKYYAIQNGACYNDDEIFTGIEKRHVNTKCLTCQNFNICDSTQNVDTYQSYFTFCPLDKALTQIKKAFPDMFDVFDLGKSSYFRNI